MKLYTYDPAPNPQRLSIFMRYKGIEIDTVQVDMGQQEQLNEEYRAINPQCTVPALVLDDGTVLTEVIGICAYLEGMHPDKPLLGTTPLEKAQVLSWNHRLFNGLMAAVAEILRNKSPGFANRALPGPLDVPQIPELAERGRLRLAHAWRWVDSELAERDWLAGDKPSLADIDLLVSCGFVGWVKESVPEDCANVQAWRARAHAEFGA